MTNEDLLAARQKQLKIMRAGGLEPDTIYNRANPLSSWAAGTCPPDSAFRADHERGRIETLLKKRGIPIPEDKKA